MSQAVDLAGMQTFMKSAKTAGSYYLTHFKFVSSKHPIVSN